MDEKTINYLTEMVRDGYLSEKYEPIKCPKCDSTKYFDKITDREESIVFEYERICKDCRNSYGYWVTGNWQII